jgi:hypothetical protein
LLNYDHFGRRLDNHIPGRNMPVVDAAIIKEGVSGYDHRAEPDGKCCNNGADGRSDNDEAPGVVPIVNPSVMIVFPAADPERAMARGQVSDDPAAAVGRRVPECKGLIR